MQAEGDPSMNASALQEAWQLEDELREAKEELRRLRLRCDHGLVERKPMQAYWTSPAATRPPEIHGPTQEPFNLNPPSMAKKHHDSLLHAAQSLVSSTHAPDCTALSERLVAENRRLESEMHELQKFLEAQSEDAGSTTPSNLSRYCLRILLSGFEGLHSVCVCVSESMILSVLEGPATELRWKLGLAAAAGWCCARVTQQAAELHAAAAAKLAGRSATPAPGQASTLRMIALMIVCRCCPRSFCMIFLVESTANAVPSLRPGHVCSCWWPVDTALLLLQTALAPAVARVGATVAVLVVVFVVVVVVVVAAVAVASTTSSSSSRTVPLLLRRLLLQCICWTRNASSQRWVPLIS